MKRFFKIALVTGAALLSPGIANAQEGETVVQPVGPLGLTQNAWNDYLRNRGESTERPGYVRYNYDPQQAFPVRIREGMITTIKLPEGEEIVEAYVGDDQGFNVGIPNPRNIIVKALFPGVDTNLIAYAESGNIYTFYLRSEAYTSKKISDFLVDVMPAGSSMRTMGSAGVQGTQGALITPESRELYDERNPALTAERVRDPYSTMPDIKNQRYREYAEWTDFDPNKVKEDLGVYVPVDQTGGIIPYRVFRDDRFTYVDYGPEASQITEWPTPVIVIQGSEGPVGNRTVGPGGRMIVLEALGDFVLRNGQRVIIIKKKGAKPDGKLVEYPTYTQSMMQVPEDLPEGRAGARTTTPKTVVTDRSKPARSTLEQPSRVVPIVDEKGSIQRDEPKPTVTYYSDALVQKTPVARGAGSPVIEAVGIAQVTNSPDVPVATQVTMGTGAALMAGAQPATPTRATPSGKYYVTLGSGARKDMEELWKSAKVQHYELLKGRTPTYETSPEGVELRIEGLETAAQGISICNSMTESEACSVKVKN